MSIVSAILNVTTTTARTLAIATNTEFCVVGPGMSIVRNITTKHEGPTDGPSSVIEAMSTIVTATVIRTTALNRPGVGASSARTNSSHHCARPAVLGAGAAVVMACIAISM